MKCSSCGKSIESENNWVRFSCPACAKEKITRCDKCKRLMVAYDCPKCKFVGP